MTPQCFVAMLTFSSPRATVDPTALPAPDGTLAWGGRWRCRHWDRWDTSICHRDRRRLFAVPLLAATVSGSAMFGALVTGVGGIALLTSDDVPDGPGLQYL